MHASTNPSRSESRIAKVVAIDLAKDVFELAFGDGRGRIIQRKRLGRVAFSRCLHQHPPVRVVMEACGSAHHWARHLQAQGHTVVLLPPRDVRPYVRGSKTDRTDAAGLLEAERCADIAPVPVKSPRQQGWQALHRIREHLKGQRTADINLVRGLLREYGITIPQGATKVISTVREALGHYTKRGDPYLRTLLIHGGRAVLRSAAIRRRSEQPLDRLQEWALELQERQGHNKAAVAVANKLARRLWALDHHGCRYEPGHSSSFPQHQ